MSILRYYKYIVRTALLNVIMIGITSSAVGQIDLANVDATGALNNPVQVEIRKMINGVEQCQLIDWDATGAIRIVHGFDRAEDKLLVDHLINVTEQLSMYSVLEQKRDFSDQWSTVTNQLKFVDSNIIQELVRAGYMIDMLPFARFDGELRPVPNAENIKFFPTSCGTFIFIRYVPQCELRSNFRDAPTRGLTQRVRRFDDTELGDEGETLPNEGPERPFYLAKFYRPAIPIATIAQDIIRQQQLAWDQEWANSLFATQMVVELIPFVSSGVALSRLVDAQFFHNYAPITASEQLGMTADVFLDALPVIVQAKKFRKASKALFVAGSVGIVSLAVANAGIERGLKIEDAFRFVTLAIVGRQIRHLPLDEVVGDLKKLRNAGVHDAASMSEAANRVKQSMGYRVEATEKLRQIYKRFVVDATLPEDQHTSALIRAFKLDQITDPAVRQQVITHFTDSRAAILSAGKALAEHDSTAFDAQISVMTRLLQNSQRTVEHLPVELPDRIWDFVWIAVKRGVEAVQRGPNPPSPGTKEFKVAVSNSILSHLEGDVPGVPMFGDNPFQLVIGAFMERQFGRDQAYDFGRGVAVVSELKIPSHFYVLNNERVYLTAPPGSTTSPEGYKLVELWKIDGMDESAAMVLKRAQGISTLEEFNHALAFIETIEGDVVRLSNGTMKMMRGVGLPFVSTRTNEVIPVAGLSFNPLTVNCYDWISHKPASELKEMLGSVTSKWEAFSPEQLKLESLDPFELDAFWTAIMTGHYKSRRFLEAYPGRVLAIKYMESIQH
jgi:hypothetical protein